MIQETILESCRMLATMTEKRGALEDKEDLETERAEITVRVAIVETNAEKIVKTKYVTKLKIVRKVGK